MILLLLVLYALYLAFWFCIVATVLALYVCLWILAFVVAVMVEVVRVLLARRRPKKPSSPLPPPQSRWSNRR